MATESRRGDLDLREGIEELQLFKRPFCFEFFQAVRLLERLGGDRASPGGFVHPSTEVVRFGVRPSLAFPASEIQSLVQRDNAPPLMVVNFMGLTGPQGVLPHSYTSLLLERLQQRDTTLRDFFDVFNHRMISLFYRAWKKYRFTVAYERGEPSRLSHYLLDLLGLGTPYLQRRHAVPDESLVFYSGLLAQRPRSATALRQVLRDYFEVPVEIEQFAGSWYPLETEDQCMLEDRDGVSRRLGFGAVVGDEVWHQQSRVRVKLGPLTLAQYLDFLPGGTAHEPLRAFTKFFAAQELDFEAQLILKREQTPPCVLGQEGETAGLLGWVTWVKSADMGRDPGDTILRL